MKKRVWIVGTIISLIFLLSIIGIDRTFIQGEEETRQLYIGDPLMLQIEGDNLSDEDILSALSEFEIIRHEREGDTFFVTVRTFEPGDYTVQIGNQPLEIQVGSTLEDYPQEDIYRVEAQETTDWTPAYRIALLISGLVFLLSLVIYFIQSYRKKRQKKEVHRTPYEEFYHTLESIEIVNREALGVMTKAFKTYLTQISGQSFEGLSTKESFEKLESMPQLVRYAQDIHRWMTWCDTYKYSRKPLDHEDSEGLYKNILAMAKHMHEHGIKKPGEQGEEDEACSSSI